MSTPDDALGSLIRAARQLIATERALGADALPAQRTPLPTIDTTTRPHPPADEAMPQGTAEATAQGTHDMARKLKPADKADALERIAEEVRAACCCALGATRTNAVPGEGDPDARIMFIGEAPGADEDAQGRPFVGAAGKLLDKQIAAMGLQREQVFIANVLKCRPPGNRNPAPDEVAACWPYLQRQIDIIQPEVIVTLGNPATQALLQTRVGITKLRGQWQDFNGIPVMPTFHPAYLLRQYSLDNRRRVWDDLQKVMQRLGLPKPPRGSPAPNRQAG